MKSSEKAWDNLTEITGIGEARQRWLRESFDIRTFQDLASLSVGQIEDKMKADGLIISRKAIEAWLAQARELASQAGDTLQPEAELPAEVTNAMPRGNGWKPFAAFVVEYQTREIAGQITERRTVAHHMEEDVGKEWLGIEGSQLCQWMLDQIRNQVPLPEGERTSLQSQPVIASPARKPPAAVKITQIRIHQPANSTAPVQQIEAGAPFQGSVLPDQPFTFEVHFELTGPAAAEVAMKKVGWSISCKADDPLSGTIRQICDSGSNSLEEGQHIYKIVLPETSLQPGSYRIWVIWNTDDCKVVLPDFLHIASFRVV
jgi:hypothetical protein